MPGSASSHASTNCRPIYDHPPCTCLDLRTSCGHGHFQTTSLPCLSDDHSVLAWATGSDAICHHTRPWYHPYPRCSGHRPLDIRSMNQQTPLRLTRWTSTCPFWKGFPLIIWIRLGGSRRMCTICRFRTLSSRGAVAGYGDCALLLPSMILLILLRTVFRYNVMGFKVPLRPALTLLPSSSRLPTGYVLHSSCLDEAAEADVAASKELLPPHLKVSFCNRLSSTALVPQGARPPRQQAGMLLSFDVPTRSSCHRRRRGGGLPMHSTTHCAYLGFWRPCSALYDVYHTVLRPLRPGGVPAHSHRGGGTSAFKLLVIAIAAWQTLPGCDVLLPTSGDLTVRREEGASAFLHHTGDACSPCSGGSDYSDRQCRSGSLWFSACPAQRPARLASALPPLYLRRALRRRQFHRRPRSDDGSMPASSSSYRRRSGAPRTHRTFWTRPRLSGLDLFEHIWVLPEGRDIPRLMQAFRERFGIRFGRCLELLQAQADTPADPCCGAPAATDVQGTRSKAAAAPHARARPSGPHRS